MKKNKVITQIKALSEKEIKLLGRYVKNSSYGKKEIINRLYQFVSKHYPDYSHKAFTKKNCFLYVFPELKLQLKQLNGQADDFIGKRLKNPFYHLRELIDDFIVKQELSTKRNEKNILLIEGLFKRGMHERAFQLIDKELDRLRNSLGDNFYYHFYQFKLNELKLNNSLDLVNETEDSYRGLHNQLDLFFTHSKIKFGFEVINRAKLFAENVDLLFYDWAKEKIDGGLIPNANLSMVLYSKIANLNNSSTYEEFSNVKKFYFENFTKLYTNERKEPLIYLLNFSSMRYKMGETAYMGEMFDLYKFGLKKNILMRNGYLSNNDFTNIITISTTLNRYNWAKEFIDDNSKFLPINIREDKVKIAKAQVESCLGNFESVIKLLNQVEFQNVYDNLNARSLVMRAYYSLEEFLLLDSFLESYYKYVIRNKFINDKEKLPLINMIKFTKILIVAIYKKKDKKKLRRKLKAMHPIFCKNWLETRIKGL